MLDKIRLFLYLNDYHWRGNAYQWFFYVGIVLTIIFEKRKMLRIVFGWVPLFYLVSIFNPVTLRFLKLAGLYNDAYFARLFSFMPLMYVITRGFSLFLRLAIRIKNEWIKAAGVCAICGIICLTGHNIFEESWLIEAESLAKTPRDTFEIADVFKGEKNVRIAPIDDSAVYLRQVADYITPYGRYMTEFGNLLSVDPPDVTLVMETAGQQDMDYIVVHKVDATLDAFNRKGYKPYALTSNYAIYRVENVNRVRRVLNDRRQIVSIANYDSNGQMIPTDKGYYSESYTYDTDGRMITKAFLDQNGTPFLLDGCYCMIKFGYYNNKLIRFIKYADDNGKAVLFNGRYETRYNYDIDGHVTRESYFDENGLPMLNLLNGYAAREVEYYSSGLLKSERFCDENGGLIHSAWGFAEMRWEYDDSLNVVSVSYYDESGNEIGSVGRGKSCGADCMGAFCRYSDGAKKENGRIVFQTQATNNHFNAVLFQVYDLKTGQYLTSFGNDNEASKVAGEYRHELPDGLYSLVFKGNSNLSDELISSIVYLSEGDVLYYQYVVDEMSGKQVKIQDFYIGRILPEHAEH